MIKRKYFTVFSLVAIAITMAFTSTSEPVKDTSLQQHATIDDTYLLMLILDSEHRVHWYEGLTVVNMKTIGIDAANSLHKLISWKQEETQKHGGSKDKMAVIIKTTATTSYKDMVEILAEMEESGIKHYTLNDITAAEQEVITNKR